MIADQYIGQIQMKEKNAFAKQFNGRLKHWETADSQRESMIGNIDSCVGVFGDGGKGIATCLVRLKNNT